MPRNPTGRRDVLGTSETILSCAWRSWAQWTGQEFVKLRECFKKLSDIAIGHAVLFRMLSVSVIQGVGSRQQGLTMGSNSWRRASTMVCHKPVSMIILTTPPICEKVRVPTKLSLSVGWSHYRKRISAPVRNPISTKLVYTVLLDPELDDHRLKVPWHGLPCVCRTKEMDLIISAEQHLEIGKVSCVSNM